MSSFLYNNLQIVFFVGVFAALFYGFKYSLKFLWEKYRQLDKSVQNLIASRIISTIHAFTVSNFAIYIILFDMKLHQNKLLYNTFEISLTLNIVMGYMLFDFILMALYKEIFDFQFIIHHAVSISAFYACSQASVFPYIAIFRLTSEASTLFINIRWFLLTFSMKFTKYYSYNGILIWIFFTVFRIVPIVPIWISFYTVTNDPMWNNVNLFYKCLCILSSTPLDVLNIFWYIRIFSLAKKHYISTKTLREAKEN